MECTSELGRGNHTSQQGHGGTLREASNDNTTGVNPGLYLVGDELVERGETFEHPGLVILAWGIKREEVEPGGHTVTAIGSYSTRGTVQVEPNGMLRRE